MKHKGAYSNGKQRGGSDNWMSPPSLFRNLDKEFNFTRDAAASADILSFLCDRRPVLGILTGPYGFYCLKSESCMNNA